MTAQPANAQPMAHPHIGWWVSIFFGMTLTGLLALNDATWLWWKSSITDILPRPLIWWIFWVAVAIHVGEGIYARVIAVKSGRTATANGWGIQTFLLGVPSLTLLQKQIREQK